MSGISSVRRYGDFLSQVSRVHVGGMSDYLWDVYVRFVLKFWLLADWALWAVAVQPVRDTCSSQNQYINAWISSLASQQRSTRVSACMSADALVHVSSQYKIHLHSCQTYASVCVGLPMCLLNHPWAPCESTHFVMPRPRAILSDTMTWAMAPTRATQNSLARSAVDPKTYL